MSDLMAAPGEVSPINEPVRRIRGEPASPPAQGTALCMSGGGYRAMLFHVGVLWRLNEAGLLPKLARSQASPVARSRRGAGHELDALTVRRRRGRPTVRFSGCGANPKHGRQECRHHIGARGIGLPFTSISDRVVKAYRRHLFAKTTLQDLPDEPRVVINERRVRRINAFQQALPRRLPCRTDQSA